MFQYNLWNENWRSHLSIKWDTQHHSTSGGKPRFIHFLSFLSWQP